MNNEYEVDHGLSNELSPLLFPKWGSDTQISHFLQKFRSKTIKSLLQKVQSFIV